VKQTVPTKHAAYVTKTDGHSSLYQQKLKMELEKGLIKKSLVKKTQVINHDMNKQLKNTLAVKRGTVLKQLQVDKRVQLEKKNKIPKSVQNAKEEAKRARLALEKAKQTMLEVKRAIKMAKKAAVKAALRKAEVAKQNARQARLNLKQAKKMLLEAKRDIKRTKALVNKDASLQKAKYEAIRKQAIQETREQDTVVLNKAKKHIMLLEKVVSEIKRDAELRIKAVEDEADDDVLEAQHESLMAKQALTNIKTITNRLLLAAQIKLRTLKARHMKEIRNIYHASEFTKRSSCLVCSVLVYSISDAFTDENMTCSDGPAAICEESFDAKDLLRNTCLPYVEKKCKVLEEVYKNDFTPAAVCKEQKLC